MPAVTDSTALITCLSTRVCVKTLKLQTACRLKTYDTSQRYRLKFICVCVVSTELQVCLSKLLYLTNFQ
jgi:hypothetical protein